MVDSALANRSNGNTSINNIVIIGDEIGGAVVPTTFAAESLTLQPGADATKINLNWYSDRADNAASVVQIAKKADMIDGAFPIGGVIATTNGITGDASAGKSWHKAGVTGLTSGTEYVYRVSNDGVNFSMTYNFKTSAESSFAFAVTGDPQLTAGLQDGSSDRGDETTAKGWQDTMAAIAARGVDFVAGVGDQVDITSNGSETEYANFFAPDEMRSLPYAPAVGNHDRHYLFNYHYNLPNEQSFTPVINSGNATNPQYQEMEVAGNYYYLYNNALFVVLNDSGYPENIEVAAQYISLFDRTLNAAAQAYESQYDWLFVQHHKSTASVADHCADRDIQYYVEAGFEKLMDKYAVDFVLAGHDHVYARSYPMYNGVPDKTGIVPPSNNPPISGGDGAASAVNPDGTVYFTTTTASGLKYYELFNNAGNLYVKDNEFYPYLVDGKAGSAEYMKGNLPLSNAKYLQDKTPGYLYVEVNGGMVTFKYYNIGEYSDTPYDAYTVSKASKYNVTFNADNGTANTVLTVNVGDKVAQPATPVKVGFTFAGWYNGEIKFDFNNVIISDITLTAKWTKLETTLLSAITAAKDFISIVETSKNSRVWTLTFNVALTYSDGVKKVVKYSIDLNGNNANQDGKYKFPAGHDLAGYTLAYDIKGNGSNIKEFKLTK